MIGGCGVFYRLIGMGLCESSLRLTVLLNTNYSCMFETTGDRNIILYCCSLDLVWSLGRHRSSLISQTASHPEALPPVQTDPLELHSQSLGNSVVGDKIL